MSIIFSADCLFVIAVLLYSLCKLRVINGLAARNDAAKSNKTVLVTDVF